MKALPALICLLAGMVAGGCATIRKFNPIESHTLEARQLTQQAESAMHRSTASGSISGQSPVVCTIT